MLAAMTFKPLKLALWLAITGISLGLGLGWPGLFWLGLLGPVALLALCLVWPLLR